MKLAIFSHQIICEVHVRFDTLDLILSDGISLFPYRKKDGQGSQERHCRSIPSSIQVVILSKGVNNIKYVSRGLDTYSEIVTVAGGRSRDVLRRVPQ